MPNETGQTPFTTDKHLQRDVAEAGERLRAAITAMLQELANAGVREQREIQAALSLSQPVTSRLISCVRVSDPLATLARVPGPQGLKKILRGAAKAGVKRTCLTTVSEAIDGVERLINLEVGNRDALDSLLSDWVHESRPSYELRQKYAGHKAACAVRGVQAQINANCGIIYPSATPGTCDIAQIEMLYGCRRVRPSAALQLTTRHLAARQRDYAVTGLHGRPINNIHDIVIPQFTTADLTHIETRQEGPVTQTIVPDLPLRKGADVNIVTAQVSRELLPACRSATSSRTSGLAAHAEPPAADMVFDVLLHDDVWPNATPELRIFDTAIRGLAHPEDPLRQADRLEMLETIVFLGRDVSSFRVAEIPDYCDVIAHVCDKLGWDTRRLRGYRCKIRYPVYGSQVCIAFPLPDAV